MKFISPKYWPLWLLFIILRIVVILPFPILIKLGEAIGLLLYHANIRNRRYAEINIDKAFPDITKNKRDELVKENFKSTAITLFELPLSWWASTRRLKKLYTIEGLTLIKETLKNGHGAIMMGGHFTSMLMCGRLLAIELPFNILIMPANNKLFETVMEHYRNKHYAGVINTNDIRTLVKALKRNEICWFSPDQDLGLGNSVFAPFMGIQAATITSTARLAKLSKAPLVPIKFNRTNNNKKYSIELSEHWNDFPSGDDVADATRVNQFIESHIRNYPEQYVWVHRRFFTRPDGEEHFY